MRRLKLWHEENCDPNDPLVIMITDFESSSPAVLHDFILILRYCDDLAARNEMLQFHGFLLLPSFSSYSRAMKFVLIFGVATTLHAIHRSLTYDATSKLNVQVSNKLVVQPTDYAQALPFV